MIRQTTIFFLIFKFAVGLAQNPCNDELFLELQKVLIDDMTDREYKYFLQKSGECENYKNSQAELKFQQEMKIVTFLI